MLIAAHTRRSLASLTVIAAIAGGSAGGVASVVTNPPEASAQVKTLGRATPSPTTIEGVGQFVNNINHSVRKFVIPQMNTQGTQIAALTAAAARIEAQMAKTHTQLMATHELSNGLARFLRVPDGRSIGNLLMTIEQQTKPEAGFGR